MQTIKKHLTLVIILIFSTLLYAYKLATIPNGIYIDEALPAYNAYSLLLTNKDEYGKTVPIAFRFIGSYNAPLSVYLTVIPIYFLGLNIFSARLLAVIFSQIAIAIFYIFLWKLKVVKTKWILNFSSLIFALSPWLFLYGRTGFEILPAFTLFSIGALFTWLALTENPKHYLFACMFLCLSTYAAYSQRFLAPLFIVTILVTFRKIVFQKQNYRYLMLAFILSLVVSIPNIFLVTTPAFLPKSQLVDNMSVISQANKLPSVIPYNISLVLAFAREFLARYITYFSPRSLFFLPDPDLQRSLPELSVFYPWMIFPYLIGMLVLFANSKKLENKFIALLLFISPLPAAFTKDPFSTHRAFQMFLPLSLIITLGMDKIFKKFSAKISVFIFSILFFASLVQLWRSYFVLLPFERANSWMYGVEQLSKEISNQPNLNFVIDESRSHPTYINLAFYLKFPPKQFHNQFDSQLVDTYYYNTNFNPNHTFGNIQTRPINWQEDIYTSQVLVGDEYAISTQQATEHFLNKIFEIKDPVDKIIFIGYQTNPDKKCSSIQNRNSHCN